MPTIEAGDALCFVFVGNTGLVECGMARVLQRGLGETFVVIDCSITDELHLGLARNGLEIWVQD